MEALPQETVLSKISHRIQYSQRIHIPVVASMGAESGPEKDLTMDGIIDLWTSLKEEYRKNAEQGLPRRYKNPHRKRP